MSARKQYRKLVRKVGAFGPGTDAAFTAYRKEVMDNPGMDYCSHCQELFVPQALNSEGLCSTCRKNLYYVPDWTRHTADIDLT